MQRKLLLYLAIHLCTFDSGLIEAQQPVGARDTQRAAFANLASADHLRIYKGHQYLAIAGKDDPSVPPRLARMMWDRRLNETSRYWALRTLVELGPAAKAVMPDLVKAMNHHDPYFRLRGSLAVLRAGGDTKQPVETLVALARQKRDAFVRMEAFGALEVAGPLAKDALPFLQDVVANGEKRLDRRYAAEAIGSMGVEARDSVSLLVDLLNEDDDDVRQSAVRALSKLAPSCPEAIVPLLDMFDDETFKGYFAAEALARGGKQVVPSLIQMLKSENITARHHAIHALRFIGRAAAPAAEELTRLYPLLSEDLDKGYVLTTLSHIGPPAVPHLIQLLKDPNADSEYKIAEAIGEIGADASAAVPALLAMMLNEGASDLDRSQAADALVEIGPGAASATGELIVFIQDDDSDMRRRAIRILAAIGPAAEEAVAPLIEIIENDRRGRGFGSTAGDAALALAAIGKPAERAIPLLLEMAEAGGGLGCVEALGQFGPAASDALPHIRNYFTSRESRLRIEAAVAVARIETGAMDAIDVILESLNSPQGEYADYERQHAARALAEIGPPAKSALPFLRKLLNNQTETSALAAHAIYCINPNDEQALQSLIRTLESEDSFGPGTAMHALTAIGPPAHAAISKLRHVAMYDSGNYERDLARIAIRAIDPSQEP